MTVNFSCQCELKFCDLQHELWKTRADPTWLNLNPSFTELFGVILGYCVVNHLRLLIQISSFLLLDISMDCITLF